MGNESEVLDKKVKTDCFKLGKSCCCSRYQFMPTNLALLFLCAACVLPRGSNKFCQTISRLVMLGSCQRSRVVTFYRAIEQTWYL